MKEFAEALNLLGQTTRQSWTEDREKLQATMAASWILSPASYGVFRTKSAELSHPKT